MELQHIKQLLDTLDDSVGVCRYRLATCEVWQIPYFEGKIDAYHKAASLIRTALLTDSI